TAAIIAKQFTNNVLVNFGGDITAAGPRQNGDAWEIGLQDPEKHNSVVANIALVKGAVATSGDLNRFLLKDQVRYTHILNPQTGWPVKKAPRQVTVLAGTCIDAGMLSTFAILQGEQAEEFLKAQDIEYRIIL
ncbi:MAG: FAD:protein FMN transferase, partial [Gammaproteobacteria bacterium]|nr:FAD:protein FMN transferase [Gammaproteobacteria bacterium]